MIKSTSQIRQEFLNFFHSKGHQIITSSPLILPDDTTLLFTNAGMNQFKDIFLGQKKPKYTRITTAQRCLRVGGKHNDLEKVGYTARHHTFFEMLGNFSFGDYFKQEAISLAWELLTSSKWFGLPKDKLLVTVYADDHDTFKIWEKKIGLPLERIIRIGDNRGSAYASDNFWQMSETGPCGPCSEIFFDHGAHIKGGLPGSTDEGGDRYIEIWNLVFMQFNRKSNGTMIPLPMPAVDTGMGLERITAVLQNVHSNYNIDLFQKLIQSIIQITGTTKIHDKSLHVIADHIRSCAFLIADGVLPSNENRSYVLRRLIRRAVRHGYTLGAQKGFFCKLVSPLIHVMDESAETLKRYQNKVEQVLKTEEEKCDKTLEKGLFLLNQELSKTSDDTLNGETLFRLYDTFGFPIELVEDICRERHISVDKVGFTLAMKEQRQRARNASGFHTNYNNVLYITHKSEFKGYDCLQLNAVISIVIVNEEIVDTIYAGQDGVIILDCTPFYPEGGGQVGDQGTLTAHNHTCFIIKNTKKYAQAIGHIGTLTHGRLSKGDTVLAQVDKENQISIRLNHSATHLLQAALRLILGPKVTQKGSLINAQYLRFDFSYDQPMTQAETREVEAIVNKQIRRNLPIEVHIMELNKAITLGAMALFTEKYDQYVRVLKIDDFSIELCGGTHAQRTGDIGLFHITSESGSASGVRRIEAVTGEEALSKIYHPYDALSDIAQLLRVNHRNLYKKVSSLIDCVQTLEKKTQNLQHQQAIQESLLLRKKAIEIKNIQIVISHVNVSEPKILRILVDNLKHHLGSAIIVLATISNGKVSLVTGVTKDLTHHTTATELLKYLAKQIHGKGGGSQHLAQATGVNIEALPTALTNVKSWISDKIKII
ncbi:Alanine--tRNA ligase [Candidatus Erwinia haradaeae]|uniref:Alanine--tRNA ligase n=1 Tax=Candidatus Erwinia haradaeae TaxID=1922217 RepID=A0A451DLC0_9GAMM|nr:alanine--tRNA ligase [Candidatus Erwinia haradaeae]VFP87515.1 Alanine--tRNA ligase [Candidatus Erwinia haradaeae]